MDLDLDLFDRPRRRSRSHDRGRDRYRSRDRRRRHPHVFAWLVLAGGALVVALAVIALLSAVGAWSALADAYFALGAAVLPASWHDTFHAIPGWGHVALVLAALFLVTGALGEVFD